ncbi:MAG: hypothetical protein LBE92_22060 [Chryseobacterium sp.]|jgi:hypothetical protein|uniref:hypothetical protein n=1 Tax=Chryseobacterium sp. TaxID=1871047 RepID=UPI002832CB9C|nr:hypothetical protein [Chryseobacterium sp.]MDR2238809.1 hypothetical protein [Chryseobacterium sp.]
MKKYTIIFLLFCLQALRSQGLSNETRYTTSQNYIYLAKLELANNNFTKSHDYFSKAFTYHQAQDSDQLLDAAASALHINNEELFKKYIIESIVSFKAPLDFILEYDKFSSFKNHSFLKSLPDNYDKLLSQYYISKKDLPAFIETSILVEKDQIARQMINDFEAEVKSSPTKIDKKVFGKIMEKADNENAEKLISITKKYGFQDYGWLILWHHRITFNDQNDSFWQYFKPVIDDEIKKGNLHKSYLATFADVNKTIWDQKQIYGTLFQYPIDNIKDVDALRESVGLPPLLYDKIVYGKPLPDEYKLTESELKKMLLKRVAQYE